VAVFGRNPFPRRLGGGPRYLEVEHQAILDRLAPGWDTSVDTELYAETWAQAIAVSIVWSINTRVRRALIPDSMVEALPLWETACRLRPAPGDTVYTRRRILAAKLRGLAGNTVTDIEATAVSFLGSRFVALRTVAEEDATTYWPGINPGPPGFEWASNRCHIAVATTQADATDAEFADAVSRLLIDLQALVPAWMTFVVGTDGPAIADVAICSLTLI
jgi:hypothetical protein